MSAYTEYQTEFTDVECLVEALCEQTSRNGKTFDASMIEIHEDSVPLLGYRGDIRQQSANVVIRGMSGKVNNVGGASNDIGWEKTETGKYRAHISGYDQGFYNESWQAKLSQSYSEKFVEKKAKKAGFTVKKEVVEGKIRMRLTRWK
jgi:hypothetical protein